MYDASCILNADVGERLGGDDGRFAAVGVGRVEDDFEGVLVFFVCVMFRPLG